MIARQITFFGQICILACDANCSKAWGISSRPSVQLSEDIDDYEYLADSELDEAPVNPGTYEGWDGKPQTPGERLNKWCARECERSVIAQPNEDFDLPNFETRQRNIIIEV